MRYKSLIIVIILTAVVNHSVSLAQSIPALSKSVHVDRPFVQEYSVKFYPSAGNQKPSQVFADRNGRIQLIGNDGLLQVHGGDFLYPGTLTPDETYLPMADKALKKMDLVDGQFVYLDQQSVFSNAWAGSLFINHRLNNASLFKAGNNDSFLITNGTDLELVNPSGTLWKGIIPDGNIIDLLYDRHRKAFYLLSEDGVISFTPDSKEINNVTSGSGFTCFAQRQGNGNLVVGTIDGFFEFDLASNSKISPTNPALPWPELTVVKEINGLLWFGSKMGAFMLREDGDFNYYYGKRWLPGEQVVHISKGNGDEVLILTEEGLGKLVFSHQTLYEKAKYYDQQVRKRHIRYGFNATLVGMESGNLGTGRLGDSDNDGLWTSMYLGGEAFRYAVTGSGEALQNVKESLDAMERLYTINPIPGFPSRSFSRSGYISRLSDPDRWQHAEHPEWDWKATTSSDEAIGHVFVFGVIAELINDEDIKSKAIRLLDELMQHIVENDWYLIDYDGKPTTWGKWHPDYVNGFSTMIGDRKLNSSNIIAMLQTAYHFTKKEVYKEKAYMLMEEHGYLENLMRPMDEIGKAEEGTDEWAEMLSESWNHSDDEMYFLGYWGLYRYAFDGDLKEKFKAAIIDHWEAERPEKEGLWNIFTAMVAPDNFDLEAAVWYLQEYPMDLINWTMKNSHRKDIELMETNFRNQFTKEVLPPDELGIRRHNANRFGLDSGNDGRSEISAGDIWLLPYWMGRYLGVITPPII